MNTVFRCISMKWVSIVLSLVTAAVALPVEMSSAAEEGLKEEVVFECDFDTKGVGLVGDIYPPAKLDNREKHSGNKAISAPGDGKPRQYLCRIMPIKMVEGAVYRLSVWAKGANEPFGIVHVFFWKNGKMPSGKSIMSENIRIRKLSPEWKSYEIEFTVPDGYKDGEVRFRLAGASSKQKAYFDDLKIIRKVGLKADYEEDKDKKVVTIETNITDFAEQVGADNIRLNIDFKHKRTGKVSLARKVESPEKIARTVCDVSKLAAGPYHIVVKVSDRKGNVLGEKRLDYDVFAGDVIYETNFDDIGFGKLKLIHSSAQLTNREKHSGKNSLVAVSDADRTWIARIIPLHFEPCRTYRMSIWTKGLDSPNVKIYYYPSGGQGLMLKAVGPEWKKSELTFTMARRSEFKKLAGSPEGEIRFVMLMNPPGKKLYFDDLKVELLAPKLKADYKNFSATEEVEVTANIADFAAGRKLENLRLKVSIVDAESKKIVVSEKAVVPEDITEKVRLSFKGLSAGKYHIVVKVTDTGGKTLDEKKLDYEIIEF